MTFMFWSPNGDPAMKTIHHSLGRRLLLTDLGKLLFTAGYYNSFHRVIVIVLYFFVSVIA